MTPAEKIISLLEDLKGEAQAELEEETAVFETFFDFCSGTLEEKSGAIKDDNLNIETANGGIESAKAGIEQAQNDWKAATDKVNKKTAALTKRTNNWNAQKAELEATEEDLGKAVRNLEAAIDHLSNAKGLGLTQEAKNDLKHNLDLAQALGLETKVDALALLANDPGEYQYHSGGITKLLDLLRQDFQQKLNDVIDEKTKEQANYDEFKSITEEAIATEQDNATQAKDRENEEKENLGVHEQNLGNATIDLTNDTQYHTSLKQRCETKHKEWAQREQGRKDEITAIGEALDALQGALMNEVGRARKGFFLQETATAPVKKHVSLHETPVEEDRLALPTAFLQVEKKLSAQEVLEQEGRRLGSATLLSLASKVTGPFEKVKKLIQALIERLLNEAANEARSQGKCGTELREARTNRQHRSEEIERTNAELQELAANRDQLEVLLQELGTAIGDLEKSIQKEAELRAEDKQNNEDAIKSAKEGLVATKEAIRILKEFYKGKHNWGGAKDAKVFVQQHASPVDEEAEWQDVAHVSGAYKGAQNKANNIFGLLDVMKTDFQREIRTTTKDEKDTEAEYVVGKRESTALLLTKRTEEKNAETDLTMTKSQIKIRTNDLKSAVERRDKAIEILEVLQDKCVTIDMPWEERKAKIEGEIAALKSAKEALHA